MEINVTEATIASLVSLFKESILYLFETGQLAETPGTPALGLSIRRNQYGGNAATFPCGVANFVL
jgi:hypothetical protein